MKQNASLLGVVHSILIIVVYVSQLVSKGSATFICMQVLPSSTEKLSSLPVAGNISSYIVLFLLDRWKKCSHIYGTRVCV